MVLVNHILIYAMVKRIKRSMQVTSPEFKHFCKVYANWEKLNSVCLTFDADFAPEYMIENVLEILKKYKASATFFATHPSNLLLELAKDNIHEVGTHPNLTPNSTQGKGLVNILDNLTCYYPKVVGNRFHLLAYSYRDLIELGQQKFLYDVSTLRYNCPYILPAWHQDIGMVLLTYTWEDGVCENAGLLLKLQSIDIESRGLKIINFHPLNIYLNGPDSTKRLTFLRENPELLNCPQKVAEQYRCKRDGSETVLIDLLSYLVSKRCHFFRLQDIAMAYMDFINKKR